LEDGKDEFTLHTGYDRMYSAFVLCNAIGTIVFITGFAMRGNTCAFLAVVIDARLIGTKITQQALLTVNVTTRCASNSFKALVAIIRVTTFATVDHDMIGTFDIIIWIVARLTAL
jgi:hypothetical protein